MKNKAWAFALVVALAGAAAPAFAGDPACLWNSIPEASRTQFLDVAANRQPTNDDLGTLLGNLDEASVVKTCNIKSGTATAAGGALAGYAFELAGARWIEAHHVATADQLDRAWNAMSPAAKQAGLDVYTQSGQDSQKGAFFSELVAQLAKQGVDPATLTDEARKALALYQVGRATLTTYTPQF